MVSDNGYPVAEATRRRVLDAVRELNYSPSVLARALVTKRTQIVGVIVGDVGDPYFAELVRGVEDVARRSGYLVIVCNADRDPATEVVYLQTLLDYRVDGVVLAGGGVIDEAYRQPLVQAVSRLEHQGAVVVGLAEVLARVPTITVDNRAAAAEMTRYVADLGHTSVGIIAGPDNVTTALSRLQGIQDVLAERGLTTDTIANGGFTALGGEQAADALLSLPNPPTAIFAVNDQMAVGAMVAAHRRGLDVPGDLTIIGFGDTTAARQVWPPLTTVSVPRHEIGSIAMTALLGQLNKGEPIESQVLECSLMIRGSSGPPRSA